MNNLYIELTLYLCSDVCKIIQKYLEIPLYKTKIYPGLENSNIITGCYHKGKIFLIEYFKYEFYLITIENNNIKKLLLMERIVAIESFNDVLYCRLQDENKIRKYDDELLINTIFMDCERK